MTEADMIWRKLESINLAYREAILKKGKVIYQEDFHLVFHLIKQELSPKWTKDVPTKEGPYWCRTDGGEAILETFYASKRGLGFEDDEHRYGGAWIGPENCGNEWAGPIPEPPKGK